MVTPLAKVETTLEDFEAFIALPENADKTFEFILGAIIEMPSNPLVSSIAMKVSLFLGMYLLENNIGHITGEAPA